tara:strand:- start:75 stop:608 length:534 start_codon:yes stop_codon:yes gene_type:complete
MGISGTLAAVSAGSNLIGGISAKKSADKAASAAQRAAEFNAEMFERDIGLLDRQRGILNGQYAIDSKRGKAAFERNIQGTVKAAAGYAGYEVDSGTPFEILRANAAEFDYQESVNEFNNEIANLQINDAQEDARLNAELTRMGGDATASALKSQGRTALIGSVGNAATTAYGRGLFT